MFWLTHNHLAVVHQVLEDNPDLEAMHNLDSVVLAVAEPSLVGKEVDMVVAVAAAVVVAEKKEAPALLAVVVRLKQMMLLLDCLGYWLEDRWTADFELHHLRHN